MKLGIVLGTRDGLELAVELARAARRMRHEVAIFAMDAGCAALAASPALASELLDDDCEIHACSNSAVGLTLVEGIVRGSQDDHAAVVGTSDRIVSLT